MRVTLASYLAQAVQEIKVFKDGPIDTAMYMNCCDKYQVSTFITVNWKKSVD